MEDAMWKLAKHCYCRHYHGHHECHCLGGQAALEDVHAQNAMHRGMSLGPC